ncbi:GD19898 [Drosophila simulans]|uniref:GD19898 n=1 Tax=Drosophila simulans TaxID=7240 RepID=B4QYY2_DROSI|nr:GD19898 [Drosophila simulans]
MLLPPDCRVQLQLPLPLPLPQRCTIVHSPYLYRQHNSSSNIHGSSSNCSRYNCCHCSSHMSQWIHCVGGFTSLFPSFPALYVNLFWDLLGSV